MPRTSNDPQRRRSVFDPRQQWYKKRLLARWLAEQRAATRTAQHAVTQAECVTYVLTFTSYNVLATHSLSGRKAPDFQHKPVKMSLDHSSVSDIIEEVLKRYPDIPESCVLTVITTKCADEAKMWKTRKQKAEAETLCDLPVNES